MRTNGNPIGGVLELQTLYNMVKAVKEQADAALQARASGSSSDFSPFSSYPTFVAEYNRFVPLVVQLCGREAEALFPQIDLGKQLNPADAIGAFWKSYLQLAANRLSAMAAYLQSQLHGTDHQVQSFIDLIEANLRPAIFSPPDKEVEIQNALEIVFRSRSLPFRREKVSIEYSSKRYIPDFTFDTLDLALEVKLCKSQKKEKDIVDEINADILAYQTKFRHALFVVFDLGAIRDVLTFRMSIEKNPDVKVLVVKM